MPTVRLQNTKSNWHTGDGDGQRRKILQFVLEFTRRQGLLAQLPGDRGGTWTRSVHGVLPRLSAEAGRLLRREAGQPRTIVEGPGPVPRAESDGVEIPLIGQIAADVPIEAKELAEETFLP